MLIATFVYPPGVSQALVLASCIEHQPTRLAEIEAIYAELVRMGVCRPPQDMSMLTALVGRCEARKRWEQGA